MNGGEERTLDELMEVIAYNEAPVTFSGGDPLAQADQIATQPKLMDAVKQLDVLVDSPFVMAERDTKLRFRGSSNQRLIDVQASLSNGEIVIWKD